MNKTIIYCCITGLFSYFIGYGAGLVHQKEDIDIKGTISNYQANLLDFGNRKQVKISFNCTPVITGILDENNHAVLVGSYKGKEVNATCSGNKPIACKLQYNSNNYQINF